MAIKSLSWMTSTALHGSLVIFFIAPWAGGNAFEAGDGSDLFLAEQGIAIEGIGFGVGMTTTEAVEETPAEMSQARPELEEIKAPEIVEETPLEDPLEALPEETQVVTSNSETATALEAEPERKEEKTERDKPQEAQVATLEQQHQVAIKKQLRAGAKQSGGDPTMRKAYLGKLRKHLEHKKINPRSMITGTVVVRFTVGSDGTVIAREVASSSGSKVLDDAALASIEKASPFPAMPRSLADKPMVVSVPFKFSVRRR